MQHHSLNYTGRAATKAVGSPSLFKAAGWRLHLIGYAHHVTAGASRVLLPLSAHRMANHDDDDVRRFVI
jgi:hypothetical protein